MIYKSRVSVSGWFPVGCASVNAILIIPSPLLTTLVFLLTE